MARNLSGGRQKLAAELEQSHSDVLVRAGNPQSDLHDQRNWITEYDLKKSDKKSGAVSVRRSDFQDSVFSLEKYFKEGDNADTELSGAMNQFAILFENWLPNSSFNQNSFTQIF